MNTTRSVRGLSASFFFSLCLLTSLPKATARELSLADRIAAQKAIEQVYWNHRIWPKENPGAKPPLSAVMPDAAIAAKVEAELRMSQLLDTFWHDPITGDQLASELDRLARETQAPDTLREIFAALGNDPFVLAECFARPTLAGRRVDAAFAGDDRIHGAQRAALAALLETSADAASLATLAGDHGEITFVLDDTTPPQPPVHPGQHAVSLRRAAWEHTLAGLSALTAGAVPKLTDGGDRFVAASIKERTEASVTVSNVSWPKRDYAAWAQEITAATALDARPVAPPDGGYALPLPAGAGCTDDTWTPTSLTFVPSERVWSSTVWTGAEMIVWGGFGVTSYFNSGGRYDPVTDRWRATSITSGTATVFSRYGHTAIWTGSEMIVWGGFYSSIVRNGGRYNPATDTWIESSLTTGSGANVPVGSALHTAVWTGSEMIVWGGETILSPYLTNTGGRYDPATDTWAASSLTTGSGANVPSMRYEHTAVWTGTEMIVWGGGSHNGTLRTGGRYNPLTDTWAVSSLTGGSGAYTPSVRWLHTALWTGSHMLVWGGAGAFGFLNTGGLYDPATDAWAPSSLILGTGANVPAGRSDHIAVWTGDEMIVWGGQAYDSVSQSWRAFNTGGRYTPSSDTWSSSSLNTGIGPNVPVGRSDHSAVWSGSGDRRMIVWGGYPWTATGGRYCAQPCTPLTWYRDVDGDGHGIPGTTADACLRPTGYAAAADDCDDTKPATYPGAVETCDGLDNDCDAATPIDLGGDALCDDDNACTQETCGGTAGCVFAPTTGPCDDGDPCTTSDACAAGICGGQPASGDACDDGNACTIGDTCLDGSCLPGGGAPECDDHSVCTDDRCEAETGCVYDPSQRGALCDDGNPCTFDACDPVEFCIFPPLPAGGACTDFDPCTAADRCDGQASCVGGGLTDCDDGNRCTDDECDPSAGCVHENNEKACDDNSACTTVDTCSGGACVGGSRIVCHAADQCHRAGACDPASGVCSNPILSNGLACDDGDLCTLDESCQGGICTPSYSGLNQPAPRTSGYYAQLCEKRALGQLPWHGDQLTFTDAACVGELSATFDSTVTIDQLCAALEHGAGGDVCRLGENELIATALNICRARVCEAQGLDSTCHGNIGTNVGQSFTDADTLLGDASRNVGSCIDATCELREINNGHALEMNALTLELDGGAVRLSWLSPELDDGSGTPDRFDIWRRPLRSPAAFMKIGTTTELTYLDASPGEFEWEYEITAVMP